jgi:hypothetical protein
MNAQIVMDTLKKINVEDGRMVIGALNSQKADPQNI